MRKVVARNAAGKKFSQKALLNAEE